MKKIEILMKHNSQKNRRGGAKLFERVKKYSLCISIVSLLISGCSINNEQGATSNSVGVLNESSEKIVNTVSETLQEKEESFLEQYEQELKNAGIEFERVKMAAEYVHAIDGCKFKIGNGAVELYSFDKNSDDYKIAEEKQAISMDGFGDFKAIVKNGIAMLISDLDEDTYRTIFDSIVDKME